MLPDEAEDEVVSPNPRRNEEVVDAAPIWAAFWSNAVADMCAGDGGGSSWANW